MKLSTLLITVTSSMALCTGAMAEGNWGKTATTNTWGTKTANGAESSVDSQQPGTDAWITTKVKASIYSEKLFGDSNPSSPSVTTINGIVILSSDVSDVKSKEAMNVVRSQNFDGVKAIVSANHDKNMGVITLTGEVANDTQRKQVEEFVRSQKIDGVKTINNQINVRG